MFDPEVEKTVAVLKADPSSMSAPQVYDLMKRFAKRQRSQGQSEQQALAKFIAEDPDGRELYGFYKAAHTAALYGATVRATSVGKSNEPPGLYDPTGAYAKLKELARTIQREKGITAEKAMQQAILTPKGMDLYLENRKARLG